MGLIARFTFDNNLLNLGSDQAITLTDSTASGLQYAPGFITKNCGDFDGAQQVCAATISNKLNDYFTCSKAFSISFWVKLTATHRGIFFGNYSGNGNNDLNIEVNGGTSALDNHIRIWQHGGVSGGGIDWSSNVKIPDIEWHHIIVLYNKKQLKIILDGGKQIDSLDIELPIIAPSNKFKIGTDNRADASEVALNAFLNDFRIYDYALTEYEIKDLNKALCIHYTFDSIGNKNILPPEWTFINKTGGSGKDEYQVYYICLGNNLLKINTEYTFTFNGHVRYFNGSERYLKVYLYADDWSWFIAKPLMTSTDSTESITFSIPTSVQYKNIYIGAYYMTTDNIGKRGGDVTINWWKIEEGNSSTNPYITLDGGVPNNVSQSYTGSSGSYGLIKNNNEIAESCMEFNNNFKHLETDFTDGGCDALTVSAWVKLTQYASSGTYTDRHCIYISKSYLTITPEGYLAIYAYGKDPSQSYYTATTNKLDLNTWYMLTLVISPTQIQGYVNTNLVITQDVSGKIETTTEPVTYIGSEYPGGSSRQFYGQLGDIKIYKSSFNSEAIKDLYETRAAILKSGQFTTSEFIEGQAFQVSRTFKTMADYYIEPTTYDSTKIDTSRYTVVSSLISTGNQYIDSLIPNSSDITIDCEFDILECKNAYLFGSRQNGSDMAFNGFFTNAADSSRWSNEYNYKAVFCKPGDHLSIKQEYLEENNYINIRVNGEDHIVGRGQVESFDSETIYLFGIRYKGSGGARPYNGKLSCQKFRIYEKGILKANFIPVVSDYNNKPGMFDTVSEKFYVNANNTSADFEIGERLHKLNLLKTKEIIEK